MVVSNSKQYEEVKNYYVPRGTLSVIFGTWTNFVENNSIYEEKYGRQNAYKLRANEKSVLIINVY